jgi:hypothetical protein
MRYRTKRCLATSRSWTCWRSNRGPGSPHHEGNPDGAVRRWAFGPGQAGQVVYLILEDQRRVDILLVLWLA